MGPSRMFLGISAALFAQQAKAQYLASVPQEYEDVSVVLLEKNLAVLPGNWSYETQSKRQLSPQAPN